MHNPRVELRSLHSSRAPPPTQKVVFKVFFQDALKQFLQKVFFFHYAVAQHGQEENTASQSSPETQLISAGLIPFCFKAMARKSQRVRGMRGWDANTALTGDNT